jgi:hypothetical protein
MLSSRANTSSWSMIRFDKQIQTVKGWLAPTVNDPMVEKHRNDLTTWVYASATPRKSPRRNNKKADSTLPKCTSM